MRPKSSSRFLAEEGGLTGEALEGDHAERPDVGAKNRPRRRAPGSGDHVVRGAQHRAGAREPCRGGRGGERVVVIPTEVELADEPGDPEVDHFDVVVPLVIHRDEDVVRLEVAVHDAELVRAMERAQQTWPRIRATLQGAQAAASARAARRASPLRAAPGRGRGRKSSVTPKSKTCTAWRVPEARGDLRLGGETPVIRSRRSARRRGET